MDRDETLYNQQKDWEREQEFYANESAKAEANIKAQEEMEMDKILFEDVKKILHKYCLVLNNGFDRELAAKEICRLFAKPDYLKLSHDANLKYSLPKTDLKLDQEISDLIGKTVREGKPDESRLLTPGELSEIKEKEFIDGRWHYLNPYEITRKQLALDMEWEDQRGFIKEAEFKKRTEKLAIDLGKESRKSCQARVERIVQKIEGKMVTDSQIDTADKKLKTFRKMNVTDDWWQALKKQEGIKIN